MKLENIPKVNNLLDERISYLRVKETIQDLNMLYNIEDIQSHNRVRIPDDVVDNMRTFVNNRLEEIEKQIKEL